MTGKDTFKRKAIIYLFKQQNNHQKYTQADICDDAQENAV